MAHMTIYTESFWKSASVGTFSTLIANSQGLEATICEIVTAWLQHSYSTFAANASRGGASPIPYLR